MYVAAGDKGIMIELAWGFLMEVILYGIGRATVAILSLGRVRAERLKDLPPGKQVHGFPDTHIVPIMLCQVIGAAVLVAFIMFCAIVSK